MLTRNLLALGLLLGVSSAAFADEALSGSHAFSLHGSPKYAADFAHFDYVNADAPKGGLVRLAGFGGFDNLNPFILKGESADGLGLVFDTLLISSADEASTEYGLLANSLDTPADRAWVAFNLRPEARFSDGSPVSASDVVWTFNTLKKDGAPFYRMYYAQVVKAEAESPTRVKFTFAEAGNRELPLIIGQMPVLPAAAWSGKNFADTTLVPLTGSGPYAVSKVDAGRSITYQRRADYWAANLPVNKGRYNFDTIRYDYYRDSGVMMQAFKAGEYDFKLESSARDWATAYDIPALREGRIIKENIHHEDPQGMQGFVFNTRREMFKDIRVRKAIAQLLDFEWMNANLFYGQYTRSNSFFANSELASSGLPEGKELEVLEGFRDKLPPELFSTPLTQPTTKGDGNVRPQMQAALDLLKEAGYAPQKGVMVNTATGAPLAFEILLVQDNFVRVAQPFVKNLERLGIKASIRLVDTAQYQNRVTKFDYDMMVGSAPQSLSPGNEQANYWNSASADTEGSANYAGVKDPVVDALVSQIIKAPDRETLVAHVKALDRVLLWGWYVIPQWHLSTYRVAYWNRFGHPEHPQKYGLGFPDTWWFDAEKDAALTSGK